jgi:hypothetical protein
MHLILKTRLIIQEVLQRILSHPGLPLAGLINPSVLSAILDLGVRSHGLSKGSAIQHCNQGLKFAFLRPSVVLGILSDQGKRMSIR